MKKVNYHTHTRLCRHAGGAAEDYAAAAWQNSLDVLGFSDHAPFPDGRFGLRMQYDELEPYIRDLNRLKTEYQGRVSICSGLEIEYCPDSLVYYESLLKPGRLDYLLLGQHFSTAAGERRHSRLHRLRPFNQRGLGDRLLQGTGPSGCDLYQRSCLG